MCGNKIFERRIFEECIIGTEFIRISQFEKIISRVLMVRIETFLRDSNPHLW